MSDTFPYFIVIVAVLLALVSTYYQATTKRRRHKRKQKTAHRVIAKLNTFPDFPRKIAYLRKIDPFVFEELLLHSFEAQGFKVVRNRSYTGDGGIDGVFYLNEEKFLIQAKRYKGLVSTNHIHTINAMAVNQGCYAVFCHTGKTPKTTLDFYRKHDSTLIISGEKLLNLISNCDSIRKQLVGLSEKRD